MGSLFIVINVTLLQFLLYFCAKFCQREENCKCCLRIQNFYKDSQFWGTPIDVIMGSYIEIAFACLINYFMFTTKGDTYNYGVLINNIFLVLSAVILVAYPIWLYVYLKKNYYNLQLREYKDKYENAYEGIQLFDNESAIWVPILYCLRRATLAICCCCLIGYPVL
jgi:hypothetical protein